MAEEKKIWLLLETIPDPEIPVISIVDLGIVREVTVQDNTVEISITPTYNGCPAMKAIEQEIQKVLKEKEYSTVHVRRVYSPAWTTDWLNANAKDKLRTYGIAPPLSASSGTVITGGFARVIACPHCGSKDTVLVSQFGSTACKALYKCSDCLEPFDYFKCH
ncbi:MAG: phenylacetate-CoA oxygenase subunit PaaJ [Bacteroidia bacterium]|nr:phenylacetate-CoA oxygenase subunit PaaJ [Bacteroidia bacterium]